MNKKGSFELAGEMVGWIFKIFMLMVVVVSLAIMVGVYTNLKIDTSRLEQSILINKVMMQPGCLNYHDGERWLPYSVNPEKFNDNGVAFCLGSKNIGLKMKLKYNDVEKEATYNARMLDYSAGCGNNGIKCGRGSFLVKVYDKKLTDGIMSYEVVMRDE